jgi:eukaryotic-like serine/threonine-protein kinase
MTTSIASAKSLIGRTLCHRYELCELLGEGAMGAVFRAKALGRAEHVAVKVLWPHLASDTALRARFEREAHVARRVGNANTVQVFEQGEEADGTVFFVMELVSGRSLLDALTEVKRMPEARAARILAQVCNALAAAHARGIVHRDVKAENVMLLGMPGHEEVKLLDFGVAKQVTRTDGEASQPVLTMCGALIGTPGYMAPELWRGEPLDPTTDVYACGALLYELVTGELPFPGDNVMRVWQQHELEAPRAPRERAVDLSEAMEAVILKALSKRREDRQQSALELRSELLGIVADLEEAERARAAALSALVNEALAAGEAARKAEMAEIARAAAAARAAADRMAEGEKRRTLPPRAGKVSKVRGWERKAAMIVTHAALGAGAGALVFSILSLLQH